MNPKADAAVRGIKDLGGEVSAWEVRLLNLQNECQSLQRRKEQLTTDMESAMAIAKSDLDKKRNETRAETEKINEATSKLEADRVEFQGILMAFKKEKAQFEDERTKILDLKVLTEKERQKLANFALMIRREAEHI